METVAVEPQDPEIPVKKRNSPPRSEVAVAPKIRQPRRRRIRSELDRLLSDEGTRNMLRGLKKPNGKKPSVFTRVIEKKVARGGQVGRRVFRKPIVVKRRRNSSVAKQPQGVQQVQVQQRGSSRAPSVSRGRSTSPPKVKIDCKYVMVSKRGGCGWVTIVPAERANKNEGEEGSAQETGGSNRRSVEGSWGVKALQSLDSAIRTLDQDTSISVIVLQSTSKYFCNGVDLGEMVSIGKGVPTGRISAMVKSMKSLISTLSSSRKLLVASVAGDCVGFGVMVLPLFDLVYANDKSIFKVHYNKLRQNPEGVCLMSPLLSSGGVGAGKLTSLLYLNNSITATEAQAAGLVHETLWPARYQEELASRLQTLSSQGDVVCASKSLLRGYKKSIKTPDLTAEFQEIEEQYKSARWQQSATNVVVTGDYEVWKSGAPPPKLKPSQVNGGIVNGGKVPPQ